MATAQQILLKYVCPSLGSFIAIIMFISPMRAVYRVRKQERLGVRGTVA
jgi:hypothetical protein